MPELPEVEVTRRSFAGAIAGARVVSVSLGKPLRWPLGCAPAMLVGRVVLGVRRRGKYLLLDLDQGMLLVHLGMSGWARAARPHPSCRPAGASGRRGRDPARSSAWAWVTRRPDRRGSRSAGRATRACARPGAGPGRTSGSRRRARAPGTTCPGVPAGAGSRAPSVLCRPGGDDRAGSPRRGPLSSWRSNLASSPWRT